MKTKLNITVDSKLVERINKDAKEQNRNRSNWIECLLYKAIEVLDKEAKTK